MCQALQTSTSTSLPPCRTHCYVDSEAAATAKVEFEFTADDGSGPPLLNASPFSVRDGYVSGDPEAEAEAVDMEDLEDHDQTTTMVIIAIAKSWRAHASLLMLFSGLLSTLVATQLLTSYWAVQPLPPGPWLVCIARVFRLMGNATPAGAPSKPLLPPPPPPVLPSRPAPYHGPWGATTVPPPSLSPLSPLTQALWLTSLAISLGCAVVASLLKKRARRVSVAQLWSRWRCQRARSSKGELAYSGEAKWSLVDMTRFFYAIHACHLVSAILYLWGLGIPLLHDSNPHRLSSLLVVVGSGVTFFLGQCLIVSAFSRVTVQYPRHSADHIVS